MGLKRYGVLGLIATLLLFCLTGCLRVDLGVVIKEDGKATLTSKLMIEESAYLALSSLENGGNASVDEGTAPDEEGKDDEDSVDLSEFKKEVVDGEVYYTLEETMELASYKELEERLASGGDSDGVDLFSEVTVKTDGEMYWFNAATPISSETDAETSFNALNSTKLTMTVTMPGEIVETSGKQLDEHTVQFSLDDFSKPNILSVVSKSSSMSTAEIAACVVCVAVLVGAVAYFVINKKKKTA